MARKRMKNRNEKVSFPKMTLSFINKYHELLKVQVKHDFFHSGLFSKIRMVPTPSTLDVLSRNMMQFRANDGSFMLGYSSTEVLNPLEALDKPLTLSFRLELDDSNFFNYTDLPFDMDDTTLFYFNNKALEKDSTETMNLSLDEFVTEEDKIDISSPLISHQFDEPQFGTEVQIINAAEEVIFEAELEDGAESIDINLVGKPEGKYAFLVDGLEEFVFYLYTGIKKIFGAVDIIIDKEEIGEYSFYDDDGNVILQEYNIHFKNRPVKWKYIFIDTAPEPQHEDFEVYDGTSNPEVEMTFEEAEEEELDSGKPCYVVWTEEEVLFKERQPEKFKLRTKRGKAQVEWITDLPCASAKNMLKSNLLDEDEVFSEIIVYL